MNTLRTRLTLAAGLVIVALTAAAFWLSYAHLHDVAAASGLGDSPVRAWAWPATLDLFIVAGEIMLLVAALAKRRDLWAVALTVAGSVGSIGLNVYGVGAGAAKIQYLVAAVPPSAALLAFGALMRQVHAAVAGEDEGQPEPQHFTGLPLNGDAPLEARFMEAPLEHLSAVNDMVEKLAEVSGTPMRFLSPDAGLKEVLDEEAQREDQPEPDEDEAADEVPVYVISTKPSLKDIGMAVEALADEGTPLSGANLAAYFGVSARSGRRYLSDWTKAQGTAA